MLGRKEHVEIGLDASKIMIVMLKLKYILAHRKSLKNWRHYWHQAQAELAESLRVEHTTVSKRLKALGMIQKQGHWMPCQLKPRDVEQRLITREQLLQRQKRKAFFASYRDRRRKVDTLQ